VASLADPAGWQTLRGGRGMFSAMTTARCPICAGPTHEIRAKLVCRQCGAILETCCEGGPMAGSCDLDREPLPPDTARPARTDSSDDFPRG
jgi:hypothetical protein